MPTLYLDLETYCDVPISHGTYAYAERAEIMLFAYAIDDGPVHVWDLTADFEMPADLSDALYGGASVHTLVAHNSMFDRTVLNESGYNTPVERWRDTMVKALAHSLPGSLGELCDILKVPIDKAKDKEGRRLVQLFCKPRPKSSRTVRATRETHPEDWAKFVEYARLDIEAMREIDKKLPRWNYEDNLRELALWHLDQRINDRGVKIDLDLVRGALDAVDKERDLLAKRAHAMTGGAVQAASQRDALLEHILAEYGVDLPDMQASTIERRIADPDLPEPLRELLAVRLAATTTSTSKYKALARGVSSDGRLRGTLQFCGASRTGRWSGRMFQPQNLPRPTLKQAETDAGIEQLTRGWADLLAPDVMALASSAIRGAILLPGGAVSDLSNIEGRVQAWLAGEAWKLRAFEEYDTCRGLDGRWHTGTALAHAMLCGRPIPLEKDAKGKPTRSGPDQYRLAYAKSFGVRVEDTTDDQRQIGKVQELALGYQGGVGAFVTFAAAYGIDLEILADKAISAIPDDILRESEGALEWTKSEKRDRFGLSDIAWIVCDSFKRSWRYAHPNIAALWTELEQAVREAIAVPKVDIRVRKLVVRRDGAWLRIKLPSGRFLCYPSPAIDKEGRITYMGVNQYSRKWTRLTTYGGKLFENVCQAVARDVMAHNMPAIEADGYQIVLTVHDEVLTESPGGADFTAARLSALLATVPPWAEGMPLAAGGFETNRYRKD